jgi:ABC-2 type transport system permease protein
MKLSEFKQFVKERRKLLKIAIKTSYQQDTAYMGERWGNLISTIVYTVTYLLFIQVLYSNTKIIASYSKNDMLFFAFLGQISFYVMWTVSFENVSDLINDVYRGTLDFVLVRPMPGLFYVSLRKLSVLTALRDGIPIVFVMFLINWQALSVTFTSVAIGIVIIILGQIIINAFLFLFALPSFWAGISRELLGLGFEFIDQKIPFEGLPASFKVIFTTIVPTYFTAAVAASVMLQKSNPYVMLVLAVVMAIIGMWLKVQLWNVALRNYTSASS